MDYKLLDDNLINKNHYRQLVFAKIDIDEDPSDDEEKIISENLTSESLQNLINNIQEANLQQKDDEILKSISKLNKYLDSNNDYIPFPSVFQNSNIIPIIINQLNREDYLDKIKRASIKCLHKIIFKSTELEKIAIKNGIMYYINIILKFPVCSATEYALCILFNIFRDINISYSETNSFSESYKQDVFEYIPSLIDYFNPNLILDLFKERIYEQGYARLLAIPIRKKITPKVCNLFLQYSTTILKDEYYQAILIFFDSLIFNKEEESNDFYFLILQAIRGIIELFSTNKVDLDYFQHKSIDLFTKILNGLNFFQKLNDFNSMSEFIESVYCLISLGGNGNNEQINSIIQIILNNAQSESNNFKINSYLFFNNCIEKKLIFNNDEIKFENNIIELLCNSIENDSFKVAYVSFSVLKNIIAVINSNQINMLLIDEVFQSIFKLIQSADQLLINDSITSFLILHDKSQNCGILELFFEILRKNNSQINQVLELWADFESSPADILHRFDEIIQIMK